MAGLGTTGEGEEGELSTFARLELMRGGFLRGAEGSFEEDIISFLGGRTAIKHLLSQPV